MDRYFLARNRDRLVLPSGTDMDKYGKKAPDPNEAARPYQDKADLCIRLAKKRNRGMPDREITPIAVKYMRMPEEQLKRMYNG